jgi:hypothetical protein
MDTMHFKLLDSTQQEAFRKAARRDYQVFSDINGLWHPAYQAECVLMNTEAATFVVEEEDE